jgi:dTDP-4-amino-4,6-dideoxygalactose transaminase
VHYIPSTHYDMYAAYRRPLPVCDRAWREILTLPLYPGLTESDISRVVDGVRSFVPAAVTR